MEKINPAHILLTILAACLLTVAGTLVLVLSGHRDDVSILLTIMMPVIAGLLAAKIDLIRRRFAARADAAQEQMASVAGKVTGVEEKVNGNFDALKRKVADALTEIAELKRQLKERGNS